MKSKFFALFLTLMVVSNVAYAMSKKPAPGAGSTVKVFNAYCSKEKPCMSVWQCYGAWIAPCQEKAGGKDALVADGNKFWSEVGACQAENCKGF